MMNKFQEHTGAINDTISAYERMTAEVRETLKQKTKSLFTAFFETHPTVKTIHWTQYSPFFNDGDECVFGVHEPYFTTTELSDLESAYGEDDEGSIETRRWDSEQRKYVDNNVDPVLLKDIDTLSRIIQSDANEDVFRAMFGNHVWVKAHEGGFEVDDYEHD